MKLHRTRWSPRQIYQTTLRFPWAVLLVYQTLDLHWISAMSHEITKPDHQSIENALVRLIERENCVLSYDNDLIDTLPEILKEQHGVASDAEIDKNVTVAALFRGLGVGDGHNRQIDALPRLLRASGIDLSRYDCRAKEARLQAEEREFDHWTPDKAEAKLDSVLQLQTDLGMGRHNSKAQRYDAQRRVGGLSNYLSSVTSAP